MTSKTEKAALFSRLLITLTAAGGWDDTKLTVELTSVIDAVQSGVHMTLQQDWSGHCLLQPALEDLIGVPYEYGKTDCIWMVLSALEGMGIDAPPLNRDWYEMTPLQWGRDLIKWGKRIDQPEYDGDIWCSQTHGILVACRRSAYDAYKGSSLVALSTMAPHCCRTSGNSLYISAFRSRNIVNGLESLFDSQPAGWLRAYSRRTKRRNRHTTFGQSGRRAD